MEPPDEEGKGGQDQGRKQRRFTNFLHGTDHLELRHFIDRINVIDPLLFVQVPLMDRVDAEKAWLSRRLRFPPLANTRASGSRFLNGVSLAAILR